MDVSSVDLIVALTLFKRKTPNDAQTQKCLTYVAREVLTANRCVRWNRGFEAT